jgi:TatD DNase family protein
MFPRVRFGYTNIVSYPNAEKTRESLRAAKKEHLLMETDAPFLPPQAFRGKTNYPKYISFVYQTCAEVLGIKQEILEKQVEENFTAMF